MLVRDYSIDDGRYINNAWLQEMPDPITKLTWDNAALISPRYAKTLGVETGDLIQITVNDVVPDSAPAKVNLRRRHHRHQRRGSW